MNLWEERAARNEALFREVNEQIERLAATSGEADFMCECSNADCNARLRVPVAVYENVRANPRAFLILPAHQQTEIERIVGKSDDYLIVEKDGTAGRIAERTDPRDE